MSLYQQIFSRAATTKFDATPLSAETLGQIETAISQVKPLLSDVNKITR